MEADRTVSNATDFTDITDLGRGDQHVFVPEDGGDDSTTSDVSTIHSKLDSTIDELNDSSISSASSDFGGVAESPFDRRGTLTGQPPMSLSWASAYIADWTSPCCLRCGKRFGLRVRRFQCFCCRVSVCNDCSSQRLPVFKPVHRACAECFEKNKNDYKAHINPRPPPKVIMGGFMWKQGHVRRNWKRRFFLLDNNGDLLYFKKQLSGEDTPAGSINVRTARIQYGKDIQKGVSWPSHANKDLVMAFHFPKMTLFAYAEDELNFLEWQKSIALVSELCCRCHLPMKEKAEEEQPASNSRDPLDEGAKSHQKDKDVVAVFDNAALYHKQCFTCCKCGIDLTNHEQAVHFRPQELYCAEHSPGDAVVPTHWDVVNYEMASSLRRQEFQRRIDCSSGIDDLPEEDTPQDGEGGEDQVEPIRESVTPDIIRFSWYGVMDSITSLASPQNGTKKVSRQIQMPENEKFEFCTFLPDGFQDIRKLCEIDEKSLLESFDVPPSTDSSLTGGRSGAFVLPTVDKKYLMKTVSKEELVLLLDIFPDYLDHLQCNSGSLLTRYVGLYQITQNRAKPVTFVVMENIMTKGGALSLDEVYDLKGSYVNRREIKAGAGNDFKGTRKDMDLRRRLKVGPRATAILTAQMTSDVTWLNSLNLMDYSLLVGIHNCSPDGSCCEHLQRVNPDRIKSRDIFHSGVRGRGVEDNTESVYFIGIIDLLQQWNAAKMTEHHFKTKVLMKDVHGISAIDSDRYATRFLDALTSHFE